MQWELKSKNPTRIDIKDNDDNVIGSLTDDSNTWVSCDAKIEDEQYTFNYKGFIQRSVSIKTNNELIATLQLNFFHRKGILTGVEINNYIWVSKQRAWTDKDGKLVMSFSPNYSSPDLSNFGIKIGTVEIHQKSSEQNLLLALGIYYVMLTDWAKFGSVT